ncbi:MAG: 4-phosphoerythronate dehydrogenase [Saccharospirillaceae bacterium]|nr:4-phosphoerythronate dehydrogenase [Pseudomonadales bacterium]NRB80852.1 4-phosphoerythronate dehydrogenase [Saccharospirillaceae bacterium]
MKILADENMPYVEHLLTPLNATVEFKAGRNISNNDLQNTDVLLVRSVTNVNAQLLKNTPVKFVGTATIGVDHIDLDYCKQNNIKVVSSPGCNADAVADYVICALLSQNVDIQNKNVGVLGLGNVGTKVAKRLLSLGANVIGFDPFKNTHDITLASLRDVLAQDIICCHAPKTLTGEFPTFHMLGEDQINQIKPNSILLNAGRGEVIDQSALLERMQQKNDLTLLMDVWENEPSINVDLIPFCKISTGHIAGYSQRGKVNGSSMVIQALFDFLNKQNEFKTLDVLQQKDISNQNVDLKTFCQNMYNIKQDDQNFRTSQASKDSAKRAVMFDQYRKTYPTRDEFIQYHTKNTQLIKAGLTKV